MDSSPLTDVIQPKILTSLLLSIIVLVAAKFVSKQGPLVMREPVLLTS